MTKRPIPEETRRDQMRASDPRVSAWVSANAGSGKTHVLTQRVIRLLLNGVPPARILCPHLHESRGGRTCRSASSRARRTGRACPTTQLREAILATGERKVETAQLAFARRLFARAVETPGGLKIQTIHAFCEKLLHRFPLEASVAARFEVIEDQRQAELLEAARSTRCWRAIHDERAGRSARRSALLAADDQRRGLLRFDRRGAAQAGADRARLQARRRGRRRRLYGTAGREPRRRCAETVADINRIILDEGLLKADVTDFAALIATGGPNDGKLAAEAASPRRRSRAAPTSSRPV